MSDLAFCIDKPDQGEFPTPANLVLISRNAKLLLDPNYEKYRFAAVDELISLCDHEKLRNELTEEWSNFQLFASVPTVQHYEYWFSITANSLLYWRHLIRNSLINYCPKIVYLPENCFAKPSQISSYSEFLKWGTYQILKEETKAYNIKLFRETPIKNTKGYHEYFSFRFDVVLDLIHLFSKLPQVLFARITHELKKSKDVIIICQPAKVAGLIRALRQKKVNLTVTNVPEIVGRSNLYGEISDNPILFSGDETAIFAMQTYFRRFIDNVSLSYPQLRKFAETDGQLLLTDHETDPYILFLVDEFLRNSKKVAFIPEGTQHHNEATMRFFGYGHYIKPGITKMVLANSEYHFWKSQGIDNELIVTGYLGNTFIFNKTVYFFTKLLFFIRQLVKGYLHKKVIFLPIEISSDLAGMHLGTTSTHQQIKLFEEFLSKVDFRKYTILAKARDLDMLIKLRMKYNGLDILFTNHLAWQIQAEIADVVVVTNTSIGIESAALNKPLLIWNNTDLPSYADNVANIDHNVIRKVVNSKDLPQTLELLLQNRSKSSTAINYFFERNGIDLAVQWIIGNRHVTSKRKFKDNSI